MMRKRRWSGSRSTMSMCGLVVLGSVGCIGPFSRSPKPLAVQLIGDHRQNVANDRGNAVVVRIYQLSGRANFDRTPVSKFWKDDAAALGGELLAKSELTLLPGGRETLQIKLVDGARFVGVAADFISPETDSSWRRIYPIVSVKKRQIAVRIGERQLAIR